MNLIIPHDKALHMVYGAAAASVGALDSPITGAALCALVAIGKEARDYMTKRGTTSLGDVLATGLGGALVLTPAFVGAL